VAARRHQPASRGWLNAGRRREQRGRIGSTRVIWGTSAAYRDVRMVSKIPAHPSATFLHQPNRAVHHGCQQHCTLTSGPSCTQPSSQGALLCVCFDLQDTCRLSIDATCKRLSDDRDNSRDRERTGSARQVRCWLQGERINAMNIFNTRWWWPVAGMTFPPSIPAYHSF
jgi:hypothetical protein